MIQGRVTSEWEPVVAVQLIGSDDTRRQVEAIVDTGFDGHVCLPQSIVDELGLKWLRVGSVVLADGSTTLYDSYEGQVDWDGEIRRVTIDVADSVPLLGMRLFEDSELLIRVVVGGDVKIRPLTDIRD